MCMAQAYVGLLYISVTSYRALGHMPPLDFQQFIFHFSFTATLLSIGLCKHFYRATDMLSAVYAVVVCLCVCVCVCVCVCHTPVLYQNG